MDDPGERALAEARPLGFWVRTSGGPGWMGGRRRSLFSPPGTDWARSQRQAHPSARSITEGFKAVDPFLQVKPIQLDRWFMKETGTWI
jgi:hypothetical protein